MQTETDTMSPSIGHTSSDQNQNNSAYSTNEIFGTPFTVVNDEKGQCFVAWGKYRITGVMESYQACTEYLEKEKWNVIVNCMVAIMQARDEYIESQTKLIEKNETPLWERVSDQ